MIGLLRDVALENATYTYQFLKQWFPKMLEDVGEKSALRTYPLFLLAAFAISRAYFKLAGMWFDTSSLWQSMHLVDAKLLETRFLESVWYAHSQPPFFNILSGLILKLSPDGYESLIAMPLFMGMGLLIILGTYFLMLELKIPARLAVTLAFIFMISPATLLFENSYSYGYPATFGVLWAALGFLYWAKGANHSRKWLFLAFLMMLVAMGFHSFFHILWLYVGFVTLFAVARKRRFQVLYCAFIPLLLATAINYKNYTQIGEFASSSWTGATLGIITHDFGLKQEEREELYATGEFSDLIRVNRSFLPFEYYPEHYRAAPTGIPVLDNVYKENGNPNFNYQGYLNLAPDLKKDALTLLKHRPDLYLGSIGDALFIYLLPISDWYHQPSKTLTFYWDWLYNFVFAGRIGWHPRPVFHHLQAANGGDYSQTLPKSFFAMFKVTPWYLIGWFQFFTIPFIIGIGIMYTWKSTFARREEFDFTRFVVLLFILYTVSYVTVMSTFFSVGENQRYRYYIAPFLAVYTGFAYHYVSAKYGVKLIRLRDKFLRKIGPKAA